MNRKPHFGLAGHIAADALCRGLACQAQKSSSQIRKSLYSAEKNEAYLQLLFYSNAEVNSMNDAPGTNREIKIDPVAKFLAVLISLTVVIVGVVAVVTQEAPARSTHYGVIGPLFGKDAWLFGITVIFLGLMPLALLAKNSRIALIWATLCASAVVAALLIGLFLIN